MLDFRFAATNLGLGGDPVTVDVRIVLFD